MKLEKLKNNDIFNVINCFREKKNVISFVNKIVELILFHLINMKNIYPCVVYNVEYNNLDIDYKLLIKYFEMWLREENIKVSDVKELEDFLHIYKNMYNLNAKFFINFLFTIGFFSFPLKGLSFQSLYLNKDTNIYFRYHKMSIRSSFLYEFSSNKENVHKLIKLSTNDEIEEVANTNYKINIYQKEKKLSKSSFKSYLDLSKNN